jgi:hypothetical protein
VNEGDLRYPWSKTLNISAMSQTMGSTRCSVFPEKNRDLTDLEDEPTAEQGERKKKEKDTGHPTAEDEVEDDGESQ